MLVKNINLNVFIKVEVITMPEQETQSHSQTHKKIMELCNGMPTAYTSYLRSVGVKENVLTIIKYIHAIQTEINLSLNYKKDLIKLLTKFSRRAYGHDCGLTIN